MPIDFDWRKEYQAAVSRFIHGEKLDEEDRGFVLTLAKHVLRDLEPSSLVEESDKHTMQHMAEIYVRQMEQDEQVMRQAAAAKEEPNSFITADGAKRLAEQFEQQKKDGQRLRDRYNGEHDPEFDDAGNVIRHDPQDEDEQPASPPTLQIVQ